MALYRKAAALSLGALAALSAASVAQDVKPKAAKSAAETLVVDGQIDWLERSDVSALTEGVVKQIEFQVGDRVKKEKPIGSLHDEKAKLTVAKAKVAVENQGALKKGEAQKRLAAAEYARLQTLLKRGPSYVSKSELDKAEAELYVADAMVEEAGDNKKIAEADLKLADQNLAEHTIFAPFDGYVTDRIKNPGESVRANEPVVRLGRIDKLKFTGYIRPDAAEQVKVGDLVDFTPTIEGADLPIERKRFRGKVSAINVEVGSVGKTVIQLLAEVDNPEAPDGRPQLRPGYQGDLTVYINGAEPPPATVGLNPAADPKPIR